MTAIATPTPATATTATRTTRKPRWARWPVHLTVIILMIIWLIPTIGLLINSFRPAAEVQSSGWWTAIFQPLSVFLR